jgi:hypothetical protein
MGLRADNANIIDFPPPVTDGQKEWEQRLANQLRPYLPEDVAEARAVLTHMTAGVERFDGQRMWEQRRLCAYILGMFPEDRASARRVLSRLSCEDDDVA